MRMNMQEEKGPSGILNNCYNGLAELGSGELDVRRFCALHRDLVNGASIYFS